MAVHLYGLPCDMDALTTICRDHNLYLIEDAAEAFGTYYKGQHVGTFGDIATFSFFGNKTITTGEGGMVTTNNGEYAAKLRQLRDHGRVDGLCQELGYNYRMSDIQAALGLSQLKRLPQFLERRREIAHRYCEAFGIPYVEGHAYHLFVILVENRDKVKRLLLEKEIQTQIHYTPIYRLPFYDTGDYEYHNTEAYYKRCLSLPIYPNLKDSEVEYVIESVRAATADKG